MPSAKCHAEKWEFKIENAKCHVKKRIRRERWTITISLNIDFFFSYTIFISIWNWMPSAKCHAEKKRIRNWMPSQSHIGWKKKRECVRVRAKRDLNFKQMPYENKKNWNLDDMWWHITSNSQIIGFTVFNLVGLKLNIFILFFKLRSGKV